MGGPERYLFNLQQLLESNLHQVIPFSIKYPINEPTEYEEYFVSSLSDDESVFFKDQKLNAKSMIKTFERNFYSKEVEYKLSKLIEDTKPDFAIVLLYLRKLSPAVLVALSKNKIPFVVRLSDFGMICPASTLFRKESVCELCVKGSLLNSVKYKCVHGSLMASVVNYLATQYHYHKKYFDLVKYFIVPSKFTIQKMVEGGLDKNKFIHIPTFVYLPEQSNLKKKENQFVYTGRIEYVKGVHILLKAMKLLSKDSISYSLKLAGNGDEEYINELKDYIKKNQVKDIEFVGSLNKNELKILLSESSFSVTTSLWYDNMPNAVLESLSCGIPVIAPRHGCFPEMIMDGINGMLYNPSDEIDLSIKIKYLLDNSKLSERMGKEAIEFVKEKHSPEKHYMQLMNIKESLL